MGRYCYAVRNDDIVITGDSIIIIARNLKASVTAEFYHTLTEECSLLVKCLFCVCDTIDKRIDCTVNDLKIQFPLALVIYSRTVIIGNAYSVKAQTESARVLSVNQKRTVRRATANLYNQRIIR